MANSIAGRVRSLKDTDAIVQRAQTNKVLTEVKGNKSRLNKYKMEESPAVGKHSISYHAQQSISTLWCSQAL